MVLSNCCSLAMISGQQILGKTSDKHFANGQGRLADGSTPRLFWPKEAAGGSATLSPE